MHVKTSPVTVHVMDLLIPVHVLRELYLEWVDPSCCVPMLHTLNIYKNVVFAVFLFINYEDLGKSTVPSAGSSKTLLTVFWTDPTPSCSIQACYYDTKHDHPSDGYLAP